MEFDVGGCWQHEVGGWMHGFKQAVFVKSIGRHLRVLKNKAESESV